MRESGCKVITADFRVKVGGRGTATLREGGMRTYWIRVRLNTWASPWRSACSRSQKAPEPWRDRHAVRLGHEGGARERPRIVEVRDHLLVVGRRVRERKLLAHPRAHAHEPVAHECARRTRPPPGSGASAAMPGCRWRRKSARRRPFIALQAAKGLRASSDARSEASYHGSLFGTAWRAARSWLSTPRCRKASRKSARPHGKTW